MEKETNKTFQYFKLFFMISIPVYGFLYATLLAFSKDIGNELKSLARASLMIRFIFWIVIGVGGYFLISYLLPYITNFLNRVNVVKMFI